MALPDETVLIGYHTPFEAKIFCASFPSVLLNLRKHIIVIYKFISSFHQFSVILDEQYHTMPDREKILHLNDENKNILLLPSEY